MKEHTYGWYPAPYDVYKERRKGPTQYELECAYKYRDSRYVTGSTSASSTKSWCSSLRATSAFSTKPAGKPTKPPSTHDTPTNTTRAKSAPLLHVAPAPRLRVPTPRKCWSTRLAATPITPTPPTIPPAPTTVYSKPVPSPTPPPRTASAHAEHYARTTTYPPGNEEAQLDVRQTNASRGRIHSATIRRERSPQPKRPVKSAGPSRARTASYRIPTREDCITEFRESKPLPEFHPETLAQGDTSAAAGSTEALNARSFTPEADVNVLEGDDVPEWEDQLDKYGWLVEIPGDPLRIKRVPKRLSYTVKCTVPATPREPPKVHMETNETFFLNTIPRKPMSFSVHPKWLSEVLHAKRMELQKRHGLNYRYKDFSFVY